MKALISLLGLVLILEVLGTLNFMYYEIKDSL